MIKEIIFRAVIFGIVVGYFAFNDRARLFLKDIGVDTYDTPLIRNGTAGASTIHPGQTKHPSRTPEESDLWLRKDYFK